MHIFTGTPGISSLEDLKESLIERVRHLLFNKNISSVGLLETEKAISDTVIARIQIFPPAIQSSVQEFFIADKDLGKVLQLRPTNYNVVVQVAYCRGLYLLGVMTDVSLVCFTYIKYMRIIL